MISGNKDTIGERAREHKKTNFQFWWNRGTSHIISGEQRNWYTPPPPLECVALHPGSQVDTWLV